MTDTNTDFACNLTDPELRDRKEIMRTRLTPHLTRSSYAAGSARLTFSKPGVSRQTLEHLMKLEGDCCPFFSFELVETRSEFEMTVTGPAGSEDMVRDAFAGADEADGCCGASKKATGTRSKGYVAGFVALCAVGCAVPPALVGLGLVGVASGTYLGGVMEGAILAALLLGAGFFLVRFLRKRQHKVVS